METKTEIPILTKNKLNFEKKETPDSSCCSPKGNASVCCIPLESKEDGNGACCTQPQDGSACCNK